MMNASSPPGEAPAGATPTATTRSTALVVARLAAAVAGVLLLWLLLSRVRLAVLALPGMGLAWLVQRARRRPYTRTAGWVGAVGLTVSAFLVALVVLAARAPAGSVDRIMKQAAETQAGKPPPEAPAFLRRLGPGMQPSPAAAAASQRLVQSRGFTTTVLVITALMGSAFAGVLLGTASWGGVTFLLFAAFGRWTFGGPPPPA